MTRNNAENLAAFIRGMLFLVPLFPLAVFTGFAYPTVTGPGFFFRTLVETSFFVWVFLMVSGWSTYRLRCSLLHVFLICFLVVVFIANIFGIDPEKSFWSGFERMDGFITLMHLVAYFFLLSVFFKTEQDWRRFFAVTASASLFVGFHALLQKAGIFESVQGGDRVGGTIGNPAFLASYLLLVLPFFLALMIHSREKWLKFFWIAGFFFQLLIIFFSGTRSTFLGIAAGIFAWLILFLAISSRESGLVRWRRAGAAVLVFFLIFAASIFFFRENIARYSDRLVFLSSGKLLEDKTVRARLNLWNISFEAFGERPWLGYGQDNFEYAYNEFYRAEMYDQEPYFDRAHNVFFDWLISSGIFGLLAYLLVFGTAAAHFSSFLRGRFFGERFVAISFLACLTAFFIHNQFIFDTLASYIPFFILLGYAEYVSGQSGQREYVRKPQRAKFVPNRGQPLAPAYFAGVFLFVLFLVIFWKSILAPVRQAAALKPLLTPFVYVAGDLGAILERVRTAVMFSPSGASDIRRAAGQMYFDVVANLPDSPAQKEYLEEMVGEMEKEVLRRPMDLRARILYGSLLNESGTAEHLEASRLNVEFLFSHFPRRQFVYSLAADFFVKQKRFDEALHVAETARDLEPKNYLTQMNLAVVAIEAGRDDIAHQALGELRNLLTPIQRAISAVGEKKQIPNLIRIANLYVRFEEYDQAVLVWEGIVAIEPGVAEYYAYLAANYAKADMIEKAVGTAQKAVALDPANFGEEAEEFIKWIESGGKIQ